MNTTQADEATLSLAKLLIIPESNLKEIDAFDDAANAFACGYITLHTQLAERDAQLAAAMEALGAHIQADAYRATFPDNDADADYLRKQETWWRLIARQWLSPQISDDAAHAAKVRVASSPAFQREIHAVAERLNATRQPTQDKGE
jgi:hypothetical protein